MAALLPTLPTYSRRPAAYAGAGLPLVCVTLPAAIHWIRPCVRDTVWKASDGVWVRPSGCKAWRWPGTSPLAWC